MTTAERLIYQRGRRAQKKADGICVDCQNTPAEKPSVLCSTCRLDRSVREFERQVRLARSEVILCKGIAV